MTDRFVLFCLKKQERKEIEKIIKSVLISSDHQFCLKWPQLVWADAFLKNQACVTNTTKSHSVTRTNPLSAQVIRHLTYRKTHNSELWTDCMA